MKKLICVLLAAMLLLSMSGCGEKAEPQKAPEGTPGWELLELAGRNRGYLVSGGEVNLERMSRVLLDEFRGGKLGKFTLEMPEEQL